MYARLAAIFCSCFERSAPENRRTALRGRPQAYSKLINLCDIAHPEYC